MLTASDIRQLSDTDLVSEVQKTQDLLFRQQQGVRTGHLKAAHLVIILRRYIAALKTVQTERKHAGKVVAESSKEAAGKLKEIASALTKAENIEKTVKISKTPKVKAAADDGVKVTTVK